MTVASMLSLPQIKNGISIGGIVLIVVLSLLQVSKININPWDKIFGWIGDRLNSNLRGELNKVDKKVDTIGTKLDGHIRESSEKDLQDTRRDILDFCNSCMNGRLHTREEFDFVISKCDTYERYISEKKVKNGVIDAAIKEIKRLYDKCIQEHSFLVEGEDRHKNNTGNK